MNHRAALTSATVLLLFSSGCGDGSGASRATNSPGAGEAVGANDAQSSPAGQVMTVDELTWLCMTQPDAVVERYTENPIVVQGVVRDIQPNRLGYNPFEQKWIFDHQLTLECNNFVYDPFSTSLHGKPITVLCHCHNINDEDIQPESRQTLAGITVGQTVTVRGQLWFSGPKDDEIEISGTFIIASEPPPSDAPPAEKLMTEREIQPFLAGMDEGSRTVYAFNRPRQDPPLVTPEGTILPETLERLKSLPAIEELKCHESLSAAGIRQLSTLESVRALELNEQLGDDVTSADFAQLMRLPDLHRLAISDVPTHFLEDAERLPPLRALSWERPQPDERLSSLHGLEGLRELSVTEMTDDDMAALSSMRKLRWLTVSAGPGELTGSGLEALTGLSDLISLSLSSNTLTPEGCRAIGEFTNLRQLRLVSPGSRDSATSRLGDLSFLAQLPHLKVLIIHGALLEPGFGENLAASGELQAVSIKDVVLSDEEFTAFAATPKPYLNILDLEGSGVGDAAMDALLQQPLPQLTYLNLKKTGVGDATLAAIGEAAPPNLGRVDLYGTNVTDAGAANLESLLQLSVVR